MTRPAPLSASYRLQFNSGFTFAAAGDCVDYLHRLGISHLYASPYLKARSGSPHGYDIVDHQAFNPEIGDATDFAMLVDRLHSHQMGLIMDIVPNHMGVGGCDNAWWLDVLEHGEASEYAEYFDIDWHPSKPELNNRLLLPLLGDHYGSVLEAGELQLQLNSDGDGFTIHYYEHCLPVDPRTWPDILDFHPDRLEQALADRPESLRTYRDLVEKCRTLPMRSDLAPEARRSRAHGGRDCRQRLSGLCSNHPDVADHLRQCVAEMNGQPGRPDSFDALHRLLDAQAYRPAYWQVASDEINYRRFFDINDLAGLCMQNPAAFAATHSLVRKLIEQGRVDGLRIDHLDGLSEPAAYCRQLRSQVCTGWDNTDHPLLVEKILAPHESLPDDWPVSGTTGYEAAHLLNGLFIRPDAERDLTRLYSRFSGRSGDFDEILYQCKQRILNTTLSSELTVLANRLSRIAEADRHTRDFTYHGLRDALTEILACFPVYRTYITADGISEQDRRYIDWAVAQARRRSQASDSQVFGFIHDILLQAPAEEDNPHVRHLIVSFVLRFQQYCAPVMAKGMEDTAFYVYNRLVSMNDVGFDPRGFGVTPAAFHHENARRQAETPHSLTATSTHDSKRGEDVRARINVLSELPGEWRRHLGRWSRINRRRKRQTNGTPAPSRNDEYLLYQTLIGVWPPHPPDAEELAQLHERIDAYMLKAMREAKENTSWINPNLEYETAVSEFIRALLRRPQHNAFLRDFLPLQQRVARLGLYNSLSQVLLKFTMPGCPDIYQGNELWAFNLVDPDNRRPVDYTQRRTLLEQLERDSRSAEQKLRLTQQLLETLDDEGRLKLYVIWQALGLRRSEPALFSEGEYLPLTPSGPHAENLVAFARRLEGRIVIAAAARGFADLVGEDSPQPVGEAVWEHTRLALPDIGADSFQDRLTGQNLKAGHDGSDHGLEVAELFAHLPVALLTNA
ncbi:malto-oligosyltrehalose synthase [Thiohalobacter thiocyanaticus]|uniref:Malto-oligosyltrehalose synthase n=1 Tax=Thiohalobacter thiocyanaticus TaxID=585455 RepID=A0A426QGW2_9GAMM|nr:malto-oligosyltrehalose synthase [Thiohalobacter thiocyanaticus]RRQ20998.1 malto-oligosyltrehalose synthase [Thiohalobacter thiocyanaticus]